MFRLFFLILFALSLEAQMLTRTKVAMGTFVSLSLPLENASLFNGGFALLEEIELALSSYDKNAEIAQLNHLKILHNPSDYTLEALALSKRYYEETQGYFDITVGSITKEMYHFGENEKLPTRKELEAAQLKIEGIFFTKNSVRLQENITLDLGGMGKGYGVDKIADFLDKEGVKKAVIALSGDIRCLGPCMISLQDPLHKEKILATFVTTGDQMGVSTSGSYERYIQTQKHNHLIDPKAKQSQQNFLSLTLIAPRKNSDLDAYATAVSVMPKKRAYQFLDRLELGYIAVESNHTRVISKNIERFVQDLEFIQE